MAKEHKLYVFHERELEIILDKLGLLDLMNKNQLKCHICGKTINRDNLGGIMRKEGKIVVLCDDCLVY